jgi:TPR repeat protein
MYNNGVGVLQDYKEAVKWYRLSAEQGYAYAQFNLALKYAKGEGVLKDYILGHMWLSLAAHNGYSRAKNLCEKIEDNMSSIQVNKAQKLAQQCLASNYKDCG